MHTTLSDWMSWEGGVDLVACTAPALAMPNVIVHVARLVHTPRGSAASGMVLFQPDPAAAPAVLGFVSTDAQVGAYFGPRIFAGTPFEAAPVLAAEIAIDVTADAVGALVRVGGHELRTRLTRLSAPTLVHRAPEPMTPFWQQGVECAAASAQLWVDGREVPLLVPPVGITGGPAAVHAPCGLYAR
ncbi:MAG: hypothetical protein KF715_09270 [Candidatus Didemnitutus sp.]|nr:hypothetical protein [Candidatus Didemnitutus sp.]